MSAELTRADFETQLGETFSVATGGAPLVLRLTEVRKLGDGLRPGGAFALGFSGPAAPALPQATYRLDSAGLGAIDMFVVPVGRDRDGMLVYEAIFT